MSRNNENIATGTSEPKVAAKDKSIPNKVLFISLAKDCPYATDGKYVAFSYDLIHDMTYEIAAELAFLVRDVEISNKLSLLLDFQNERPDDYETLIQSIQRGIIAPLLQVSVPEEVTLHFPDSYIEWLVYNTDQIRAEIGRNLKNQDNTITLYTSDIFKEYVENGMLPKIKKVTDENPEITNFSVIDTDLEKGLMLDSLMGLKADWMYRPFHGDWIQAELGCMYSSGIGVSKDLTKAASYYANAAEKGNIFATNYLGYIYQCGLGVAADGNKAFELYQKAAEQNHDYAIANVGYCYHNGIGTAKDLDKAACWYEKAAEKGVEFAQHNLAAIAYDKGDYAVAFKWYKNLSENNNYGQHASILYWVGYMYKEGLGITKDENYAYSYLAKASDLGIDAAHRLCAELTANGFGVFGNAPDIDRTKMYYNRGRKAGDLESNIQMAKFLMGLQKNESISREILEVLKEVIGKSPEARCMYITYMRENPEILDQDEMDLAVKGLTAISDQYTPAKQLLETIQKEQEEEQRRQEEEQRKADEEFERLKKMCEENKQKEIAKQEAEKAKQEEKEREAQLKREKTFNRYNQTPLAIRLLIGNETNFDFDRGVRLLVDSAQAGDPLAKAWVGHILLAYNPTMKEAFELISSAAYGNPQLFYRQVAQYYSHPPHFHLGKYGEMINKKTPGDCFALLANCYLNGWGTPQDLDKAHELLQKAIRLGSGFANTLTGICYYNGIGTVKDTKAAKDYFEKAAKYNDGIACNYLAMIHIQTGSNELAGYYAKRSAYYGCAMGMCNFADALRANNDKAGAEKWYRQAIIQSEGNKELIQYATKQLKAIGGRVPEWKPSSLVIYIENGVPTLQRPASYCEPPASVEEKEQKPLNDSVQNAGHKNSVTDSLKEAVNSITDKVVDTAQKSSKSGLLKKIFGFKK